MMTKEQAIDKLKQLQKLDDYEKAHAEADGVLRIVLINLGQVDIVNEWDKVPKEYA